MINSEGLPVPGQGPLSSSSTRRRRRPAASLVAPIRHDVVRWKGSPAFDNAARALNPLRQLPERHQLPVSHVQLVGERPVEQGAPPTGPGDNCTPGARPASGKRRNCAMTFPFPASSKCSINPQSRPTSKRFSRGATSKKFFAQVAPPSQDCAPPRSIVHPHPLGARTRTLPRSVQKALVRGRVLVDQDDLAPRPVERLQDCRLPSRLGAEEDDVGTLGGTRQPRERGAVSPRSRGSHPFAAAPGRAGDAGPVSTRVPDTRG